jgi:hypothetical protein
MHYDLLPVATDVNLTNSCSNHPFQQSDLVENFLASPGGLGWIFALWSFWGIGNLPLDTLCTVEPFKCYGFVKVLTLE